MVVVVALGGAVGLSIPGRRWSGRPGVVGRVGAEARSWEVDGSGGSGWDEDSESDGSWDRTESVFASGAATILVGVELRRGSGGSGLKLADSLAELGELATSAGLSVVGERSQRLAVADPLTFVDASMVAELKGEISSLARRTGRTRYVVLFDDELEPRPPVPRR